MKGREVYGCDILQDVFAEQLVGWCDYAGDVCAHFPSTLIQPFNNHTHGLSTGREVLVTTI